MSSTWACLLAYSYSWIFIIENELVTPPLEMGVILPGVVRKSILDLVRGYRDVKVSEREINMSEVINAQKEGRVS